MATQQAHTEAVRSTHAGRQHTWRWFLLHVGEMIAAMILGMVLLMPAYGALMGAAGYGNPGTRFPEISAMAMAVTMTVPMVGWMLHRGHTRERSLEMAAAMILPAVVLVMLCVLGALPHVILGAAVMIVMVPCMIGIMLFRRDEYTHSHVEHPG